jgi:hypothetical protein
MTRQPMTLRTVTSFAVLSALLSLPVVGRAQASTPAPAPRTATMETARGFGQCEIFLMKKQGDRLEALVYNTTPLNDCPPARFDAMNAEKIAQESGSDIAWKNPRRFWMMDRLTVSLVGDPREFDGLPFNFVARMQMPAGFQPGKGQAGFAY